MSGFESLVRPAQLTDISPAKVSPLGTSGGDSAGNTTTLKYGDSGSAKMMFATLTIDESYYAVKKMREKPKT
jgi:hypothetical protein